MRQAWGFGGLCLTFAGCGRKIKATDKMARVGRRGGLATPPKGGVVYAIHMDILRPPAYLYDYAGCEEQRKPPLCQVTVF